MPFLPRTASRRPATLKRLRLGRQHQARNRLATLLLVAALSALAAPLAAQQPSFFPLLNVTSPAAILLGAPAPAGRRQSANPAPGKIAVPASTAAPASAAIIHGVVADIRGGLVPGARILLAVSGSPRLRRTRSDAVGDFSFANLPAGTYTLTVSSPGLETFVVGGIALQPGEDHAVNGIDLPIPASHADITVTVTRTQLATEEIHEAEQQRVLGVFPNFYTSFVWNAAPLNSRQKFGLALHATTDPVAFITAGVVAGAEQIDNTFPEYGGGPAGFAKRYGAAYADGFIGKVIGSALLPSVFRQDPRYFYMGSGTVKHRALHAIASAVLARGDNGRWQPNYSHVLGNAAAGAISSLYHPASDSAGKLALDNALIGIAGSAGVDLVREFLLKPFTIKVPAYAKGKP